MQIKYPLYQPQITRSEKSLVKECLDSTWISSKGKYIEKFETKFSEMVGENVNAISVSNGTVALHLALLSLGLKKGDQVIVPSLTYVASVNAIAYVGATPVFSDCELGSWQLDPRDVRKKITKKTKAILCVHLYGQSCDMKSIKQIANEFSLKIIEDCAEAIGTSIDNESVGNFSDVATWSFFGNKTITTGEGGMVTTRSKKISDRVRKLKGQGLATNGREYFHDVIGYNYRMTNICAALGYAQISRLDKILKRKREIAHRYINNLKKLDLIFQEEQQNTVHSYWLFSVLTKKISDKDKLRKYLASFGIETRPVFIPIHQMPMYKKSNSGFENSVSISKRGVSLPSYPNLTNKDVDFISKKITNFFLYDKNFS